MALGPGSRLDTYEIVDRIASGGMGEVWLARDLRLDRKVAVKVLPSHLTDDPDRVARFRHEARAASALNHPNVCTIHTLGIAEDGRLFIAMEYIEGTTLRERLAGGPVSMPQALDISAQIAAALAAAHTAGVIHRDVKPENVIVRTDGLVKVLDFGLAKLDPRMALAERGESTRTAVHTDGGLAIGTIAYMSPEQARGEPLDARTDICSLGAVLYEMVTGHQAFPGNSPVVVLDAVLNRMPTSPLRLNADIPPRLEDIISKALEKDRDLRYQTASELRTDLIRLKRDTDPGGAVTVPDTGAAARFRGAGYRNRRTAVALGVLMFAAILAVLAIRWRALQFLVLRLELQEVQLTTNSSENPVSAAAISPDGKYLAYADLTGIHVRLIDSGETHALVAPDIGDINRLAWFPDGSTLVVSANGAGENAVPAIWSLSIIGGSPRKLGDHGIEASVSPDRSQIAFVDGERRHVWIMGANGEEPHQVVTSSAGDTFYFPGFWDGARVSYGRLHSITDKTGVVRTEISAEWRDPDGHTASLVSDPGLRAAVQLPDGRSIYSLVADPVLDRDATLWQIDVDPRSGLRKGQPRRLHGWAGSVSLWQFSSSAAGKRITFLKRSPQKDVYVADLRPSGDVANPRRFTLDDSTDFPTNWTPDSRAILFSSDRNGTFDVYRQSLDQRTAEAVVAGPDDESGPTAVSPDGAWFYYIVEPKGWRFTQSHGVTLMRTPASGGPRQKVQDARGYQWALCARSPSTTCVLVEQDAKRMVVYALDAVQGKGREITSTPVSNQYYPADLSPDGSRVAIVMSQERRIRILSLQGEPSHDVAIPARPLDPRAFYWSSDGAGWYISSTPPTGSAGSDLLHVDLEGHVKVVWHHNVPEWTSGIPSPDGRHLALTHATIVSNVWMLKEF